MTMGLPEYRTCQFCREQVNTDRLVKYGIRHYAHPVCLYKHKGEAALRGLHAWQIRKLPAILLHRAGFTYDRQRELLAETDRGEVAT